MSTGGRIAVLVAVVVVAIAGLVIAQSGSDDESSATTTATTPSTTTSTASTTSTATGTTTSTTTTKPAGPPVYRITVENAKPVGGVEKIKVDKNDQVNLVVTSDTADEIHIHGYDLKKDIEAGGTVRFKFKADIDGGFEIELEDHKEQIAELEVQP